MPAQTARGRLNLAWARLWAMDLDPPNTRPSSTSPDVWEEQAVISRQLAAWSIASILGGSALALAGQAQRRLSLRAFGGQNAAWGVVDLGIAGFGEYRRRGRLATMDDPDDPAVRAAEWGSLCRILRVNAGLDVGYVAAGLAALTWAARADRPAVVGHGAAVVMQGSFLLAFDLIHAGRTPPDVRDPGRPVLGQRRLS